MMRSLRTGRVKFGSSSRDASAPKSITPGPSFVAPSVVGTESPSFSFGKEPLGGVVKTTSMETPGPEFTGISAVGKQTVSTKRSAPSPKCVLGVTGG